MTAICVARECEMVISHEKIILIKTETDIRNDRPPKIFLQSIADDCDINNIDFTDTVRFSIINFLNTSMHYLQYYYFAMDGKTFDKLKQYHPDVLQIVLLRTKVFARFQPDQKTQLVVLLQELDFIVSMVGDGANDCGVRIYVR